MWAVGLAPTWPPDWSERLRGKDCPMCAQDRLVASAFQRHFRPVKMNYQTLGNAVPHLHTHLVPRFAQDPAPGRPLPFPEGERPGLPEETLRRDALALRALV